MAALPLTTGHRGNYSSRVEDFLAVTALEDPARRTVWRAFWGSRAVIFLVGVVAVAQFGNQPVTSSYDPDGLTAPFGSFANLLLSPFARFDSVWYLAVAKWGYGPQTSGVPLNPSTALARMNFFPLYPALIHVLGWVTRSDLIAGVLISLVAFAVALLLLYRLVALDFSEEVAAVTVMLLAFCPMSFFFSAVYTESLFMALSVGCIYAARLDRWWLAGLLGAFAAATRIEGVVLLVPLAFLLWPRRRKLPIGALGLGLIPLGLLAYLAYLGIRYGEFTAPFRTQHLYWMHQDTWPFGAIPQGVDAAWNGLRQLIQGPVQPYRVDLYAGGPSFSATQDIYNFLFLVLIVGAFICGLRRLPPAYSAYTLLSLALPLSDPVVESPLGSIPRYAMVAFPLFIWGAEVLVRRRWTTQALVVSAVLLGLFTAEFSSWVWVG